MAASTDAPWFVRVARILFLANAAIWLAFGVTTLAREVSVSKGDGSGAILVAVLMLGNSAAMLAAGIGIGQQKRLFFYFAILVLVTNIFLSLADQFGFLDFLPLLISGFLLGLVGATRSYWISAPG